MYRSRRFYAFIFILVLLAFTVTVSAQVATPTTEPPNPNANISWPPPVYVLRGQFTLRGSANLQNMTNYFIEFRALNPDLTEVTPEVWLPAILPSVSAVQDSELGVWNTTTAPDGIYELRLTVNVAGGAFIQHIVRPVRVENNPPPFAATQAAPTLVPTPVQALPTLLPTPTAFDPTPRVVANLDANVRAGDGTNYPVVGSLLKGDSAPIVGISSFGTGWYLVQLATGSRGWISPSVVSASGNLAGVPRVEPPPPPTNTPVPYTPTPVSSVNLVAGNYHFDPASPKCNQTFNIYMDVANFGTTASPSGVIGVQDYRRADGTLQGSTVGGFPSIAPGTTISVGPIPLTISTYYNEEHRLLLSVDSSNLIPETNEGDNVKEAIYTLERASCP